jgi:pilus assembly protein CpaB
MNRSRLLMIGLLALALGGFVSLLVYKNLQSRNTGTVVGTDVIVAADDVQVGARIEDHDVRIAKFPAGDLPPGAYTKRSQVMGRGVVVPIYRGEFILPNRLAAENAGSGLPSLIPPGMRAVSVRVNEIVSVAGFVTPGTRVDVLLTGTPNGGTEPQTATVLQNVAVIAAGSKLERSATGEPLTSAVITLLVSPDDAQRLTLASAQGHIQLSLRNPLDTRQDEVASSNEKGLYKGGFAPPTPTPVVHHAASAKKAPPTAAPAPSVLSIEVYQGDKKPESVKCSEDNCETSK